MSGFYLWWPPNRIPAPIRNVTRFRRDATGKRSILRFAHAGEVAGRAGLVSLGAVVPVRTFPPISGAP